MYYRVIPFQRTFDTFGLIYRVGDDLRWSIYPWKILTIPFRDTQELAIVVEEVWESDLNCKKESIKDIICINSDFIFLSLIQLQIITFLAQYYMTPIHHALWLYFPKNLVEKIAKDTFEKIKIKEYNYPENIDISITPQQQNIYQKINNNTEQNKHLIYGVTWSGKTQIYMKIIAENLKLWKQTLLLIPEIILTSQIGSRIRDIFGDDVIMLHSGVSAAKKSQYWMDIHYWNAKVIIGTRSSLFYPYNNLGAIIIDEEHDQSYISDSAPRYHTLDIAEKLSQLLWITLVLGSGTPKVKTFYRWLRWDFQVLQLLEKYK